MKQIYFSILLIISFIFGFGAFGQEKNDSLLNIYTNSKIDSSRIQALHQYVSLNFSSPKAAIKYARIAIDLSKKIENLKLLAKSYNQLAVAYYYKGELTKSSEYLDLSLTTYSKIRDKSGMATCYNGIGVIYYDQGKLYKALQLYIQSLRIKEKLGDKISVAMTLNNIGNVYKDLENFDKSLEYYNKSIKIKEEINDKHGLAMTLNNIGLLYHNNKQYVMALFFYSKSLEIKKEIKDLHGEAMTLNNIGLAYELQKKYGRALKYYEESVAIKKKIGDQYGLAMSLINLGTIYREIGDFDKCYEKLLESEKIALSIDATTQLRDCYQRFYETYEIQGKDKQALNYYKLFNAVKDSMMNEESFKNIQKLQAEYENEKKQLIIQNLLKKEDLNEVILAKNKAEISKKNIVNLGLVIGLLISIGLIIFFFFNIKQRTKRNEVLTQTLKEKDVLFKEVHHRVKNNFQVISSLLNLHANNTENKDVIKALGEAKDRVGSMSLVHEKLYLSDDLSRIKMDEYVSQLIEHLTDSNNNRHQINTILKIKDIFIDIEFAIPLGLIFNELITNSIKYAFLKDVENTIEIEMKMTNNTIDVDYKDNGIGFPSNFDIDNLESLGLNLVQILVLQIHGELKINEGVGTHFSFTFELEN